MSTLKSINKFLAASIYAFFSTYLFANPEIKFDPYIHKKNNCTFKSFSQKIPDSINESRDVWIRKNNDCRDVHVLEVIRRQVRSTITNNLTNTFIFNIYRIIDDNISGLVFLGPTYPAGGPAVMIQHWHWESLPKEFRQIFIQRNENSKISNLLALNGYTKENNMSSELDTDLIAIHSAWVSSSDDLDFIRRIKPIFMTHDPVAQGASAKEGLNHPSH